MKRLVLIIAALVLVSCSESVTPAADSAPEAASSSETTVAPKKETPTETSVTTETKPAKTVSYKQIEVEVKDISNDMLSFTFEGADYEVRIRWKSTPTDSMKKRSAKRSFTILTE